MVMNGQIHKLSEIKMLSGPLELAFH